MQETKKNISVGNEESKKKERHIVTWTQQEDDILREQISIHGTENWSIIASKFQDKTTRQCRRRWYTYLNSDFKKGGWSPEEDMLLCEAQKIFGNRWTEIAKVVSGRTDNAVKNRFSTLCKKRAKYEALAKENNTAYINQNSKRILFQNGFSTDETSENAASAKRLRRPHIPDITENCDSGNRSHKQPGTTMNQQLRHPLAVLAQNFSSVNNLQAQHHDVKEVATDAHNNKIQGTFLKKDDPKITALMQQAELLSSLALKVNTENTEQSLENAWKVLQDFLSRSKENDILRYKISENDFQIEDFRDLIEDLRSSTEGSRPSWRQSEYEESPASSEYSTGSTLMPHPSGDKTDQIQAEISALHQDTGVELQSVHTGDQHCSGEQDKGSANTKQGNDAQRFCMDQIQAEIGALRQDTGAKLKSVHIGDQHCSGEHDKEGANTNQVGLFSSGDEDANNDSVVSASSSSQFSSPPQVTPLFRSLAAGIPSPNFSESERNFLLRTLGIESPCPHPSANPLHPPPCKRALLHSL